MCALGQNKLMIYFSDIVNIYGAKHPANLKQYCSIVHNTVLGDYGSKVTNVTPHASVIIIIIIAIFKPVIVFLTKLIFPFVCK